VPALPLPGNCALRVEAHRGEFARETQGREKPKRKPEARANRADAARILRIVLVLPLAGEARAIRWDLFWYFFRYFWGATPHKPRMQIRSAGLSDLRIA
jgi:hypothetical protein